MACEKIEEKDCFSVTWSIHNFSYCWQKTGKALASPAFNVSEVEGTIWQLLLFPFGRTMDKFITISLCKENDTDVVKDVNYGIQFLASDGSVLDIIKDTLNKCSVQRSVITEGTKYLPQDILTVRFRVLSFLRISGNHQLFARTIINIENISLRSSVEKFSNWEPQQAKSFLVKSPSKDIIMPIELFLTSNKEPGILVNISTFKRCTNYFTLKTFILDNKKNKVDAGEWESWLDNGNCSKITLKFTKDNIMRNKSLYLPNDVLTLCFELTICTGQAFYVIEKANCDYTSISTPNIVTAKWRECIAHENIADCPCPLITDLTSLQKDHSTCDMKLKTKTNVFPVHTLILSARSPVFKAMFSSEMKETVNGCVNVSDLDDETVRRLLLYMYTNQLEDLEWEDAFHLYVAADKYAVTSLKEKCSAFLKNNLLPENVCKVLTLGYLHQDKDLKVTAQEFILKNATEILKSEEWKLLVDTYSKLAIETISRNWIKD